MTKKSEIDLLIFDLDGVVIDSNELLDPDDIAMLCRMAGTRLVFFNACSTARPATYITRHGVPFSIFATIEIPMSEAWQRPAAFYRACTDASDESILSALLIADGGDARYSHVIRPEIFLDYIREVKALRETQVVLTARVSEMRADVDRIAQVISVRPTVSPRRTCIDNPSTTVLSAKRLVRPRTSMTISVAFIERDSHRPAGPATVAGRLPVLLRP